MEQIGAVEFGLRRRTMATKDPSFRRVIVESRRGGRKRELRREVQGLLLALFAAGRKRNHRGTRAVRLAAAAVLQARLQQAIFGPSGCRMAAARGALDRAAAQSASHVASKWRIGISVAVSGGKSRCPPAEAEIDGQADQ